MERATHGTESGKETVGSGRTQGGKDREEGRRDNEISAPLARDGDGRSDATNLEGDELDGGVGDRSEGRCVTGDEDTDWMTGGSEGGQGEKAKEKRTHGENEANPLLRVVGVVEEEATSRLSHVMEAD